MYNVCIKECFWKKKQIAYKHWTEITLNLLKTRSVISKHSFSHMLYVPQFTTLWTKIETHSYHCLLPSLFLLYGPIGNHKWQITESTGRWVAVVKAQTVPKRKDGWRQPTANATMLHGAGWKEDKIPESSATDVVAFDRSAEKCNSTCNESSSHVKTAQSPTRFF